MPVWLWMVLVVTIAWLGLSNSLLMDVDEGAFSEASREMLVSGDWGNVTLNGADRFDKPILIYWLQASALATLGVHEWAVRFPSFLASLLWFWGAVRFAELLLDRRLPMTAAAMLASSLGIMLIGRAATADAMLNAILCWTCLACWRHLQNPGSQHLRMAYFWVALGLLTKGPVAVLIPGGAVLLYLLTSGQSKQIQLLLNDPVAWVILLLIAVPWYAYAFYQHGMAFMDGFVLQHNVNRFLRPKEGHGGAWYYTLVVGPLLLMPWSPLLVRIGAQLKNYWAEPLPRFLLCWSVFSLVFFTISSTKLPHYLLYGLTPLLILAAQVLMSLRSGAMTLALFVSQACLLLAMSVPQQTAFWLSHHTADPLYQTLLATAPEAPPIWQWLMVFAAWMILWCWPSKALPDRATLAALCLTAWAAHVVLPWWSNTLQSPVHDLAEVARLHGGAVTQWQTRQPSFAFYLQAPTPSGEPPIDGLALVRLDRMPSGPTWKILSQTRGLALIQKHHINR